ncbi:myosin-10-like [Tetranychus urticae]|uniref:myosin-10-like n=1 Tax=Tetranychus urticae TaxID=32264 RepID=UPI000D659F16|nr:myosin-10-like [Tetranychus urticae]
MQSDQAPQTEQLLSPEGFKAIEDNIVNNQALDIFAKETILNNFYNYHKKVRNPKELPIDESRLKIESHLIRTNPAYDDEKKEELIDKLFARAGKSRMSLEELLSEEKDIMKNPDLTDEAKDRKLEELYTSSGRAPPPPKRARKDPEFTATESALNTKVEEIKELNKAIQKFETEKTQLNKARDDLSREKQALEREKTELTTKLNTAENDLKSKKDEITRLTTEANKVTPLETQLAEVKRKYDDLQTEKTGIDQKLKDAEREINAKKEQIDRLTTADEKVKLDEKLRDAEKNVNDKNQEISNLKEIQRNYDSLKTEKEGLERRIKETQKNLNDCNIKVADLDEKKSQIDALENDIRGKDQKIRDKQIEVNSLMDELIKVKKALSDSETKLNVTKEEYTREINKLKSELGLQAENTTNESTSDKPPRLEYSKGIISIIRGWIGNMKLIPKFKDADFIRALGFIDDPSESLITNPKVTASRPADLNARSSLMFVYSDIVAPHFVGDKLTRVLRILPLKRGQRHEIVHERFVKPFYYPVRTNQIEDVNFILTDETGNPIKFASGRVAIGLHLKRFV